MTSRTALCQWCEKPVSKRLAIILVGKLYMVCRKCHNEKVKERGF